MLTQEEISALEEIDSLTGIPHPDDELLFAVAMCAPVASTINYTYRIKLVPGSTKKGKAVKTVLHIWLTSNEYSE